MYICMICFIFILYIILYKLKYTKYSKKIFCITIFILFTLIQGLRSQNVGIDTSKYIDFYLLCPNITFEQILNKEILGGIEVGFGLLMKILSTIGCPPQIFLIIVAAIINGRNNVFYL